LSSFVYIIIGLVITLGAYFLVTWGLSSLYFLISHEKLDLLRVIKISATLAGAALVSTILGMIAFSSLQIYFCAMALVLISFGIHFYLLHRVWKFNNFDGIIIATTLAIILNPAWLQIIGII